MSQLIILQCFELMDTENELLHVFDKSLSLEQFYVLYFEPYLIISLTAAILLQETQILSMPLLICG